MRLWTYTGSHAETKKVDIILKGSVITAFYKILKW